jgi:hypothetical protein
VASSSQTEQGVTRVVFTETVSSLRSSALITQATTKDGQEKYGSTQPNAGYAEKVQGRATLGQPTMSYLLTPIVCCYLHIVRATHAEATK